MSILETVFSVVKKKPHDKDSPKREIPVEVHERLRDTPQIICQEICSDSSPTERKTRYLIDQILRRTAEQEAVNAPYIKQLCTGLLMLLSPEAIGLLPREVLHLIDQESVLIAVVELSKMNPPTKAELAEMQSYLKGSLRPAHVFNSVRNIFHIPETSVSLERSLPQHRTRAHPSETEDGINDKRYTFMPAYSDTTRKLIEQGLLYLSELSFPIAQIERTLRKSALADSPPPTILAKEKNNEDSSEAHLKTSERAAYLMFVLEMLLRQFPRIKDDPKLVRLEWLMTKLRRIGAYAKEIGSDVIIKSWKKAPDLHTEYGTDVPYKDPLPIVFDDISAQLQQLHQLHNDLKSRPSIATSLRQAIAQTIGSDKNRISDATVQQYARKTATHQKEQKTHDALGESIQQKLTQQLLRMLYPLVRFDVESHPVASYAGFLELIQWVDSMAEIEHIPRSEKLKIGVGSITRGSPNTYVSLETINEKLSDPRNQLLSQLSLIFSIGPRRESFIKCFHETDSLSRAAIVSTIIQEMATHIFLEHTSHPLATVRLSAQKEPVDDLRVLSLGKRFDNTPRSPIIQNGEFTQYDSSYLHSNRLPIEAHRELLSNVSTHTIQEYGSSATNSYWSKEIQSTLVKLQRKYEHDFLTILKIILPFPAVVGVMLLVHEYRPDLFTTDNAVIGFLANHTREEINENLLYPLADLLAGDSKIIDALPFNPYLGSAQIANDTTLTEPIALGFFPEPSLDQAIVPVDQGIRVEPLSAYIDLKLTPSQLLFRANAAQRIVYPPSGYKIVAAYVRDESKLTQVAGGGVHLADKDLYLLLEADGNDSIQNIGRGTPYVPEITVEQLDQFDQSIQKLRSNQNADTVLLDILETSNEHLKQLIARYSETYDTAEYQKQYSLAIQNLLDKLTVWKNENSYYSLSGIDKINNSTLLGVVLRGEKGYFCTEAAELTEEILTLSGVKAEVIRGRKAQLYPYPGASEFKAFGDTVGHAVAGVNLPDGQVILADTTPYASENTSIEDIIAQTSAVPDQNTSYIYSRATDPSRKTDNEAKQPFLEFSELPENANTTVDLTIAMVALSSIVAGKLMRFGKGILPKHQRRSERLADPGMADSKADQGALMKLIDSIQNIFSRLESNESKEKWVALLWFYGTDYRSSESLEVLQQIVLNRRDISKIEANIIEAYNKTAEKYSNFEATWTAMRIKLSLEQNIHSIDQGDQGALLIEAVVKNILNSSALS